MNKESAAEHFTTRWHRSTHLLGYLFIFGTALRRINELDGVFSISMAVLLIALFTILYASERWLSKRFMGYPRIYFVAQILIVQCLGFFAIYIDTWAVLYIVLGLQTAVSCKRKEAVIWWGLFIGLILGSFFYQFGVLSGLGRGMAYIVVGVLLISFDNLYALREDARSESQVLLEELRTAHARLEEQASQTKQLAALQERGCITQEIHDAVGQKVFAIQLITETTCVLLQKDHPKAIAQLELLQAQTQEALNQMRQLISRWRASSQVSSPPEGGEKLSTPPLLD